MLLKAPRSALRSVAALGEALGGWHLGQHWVLLKVLLKAPRSLSWAPQKEHRLERYSD